MTSVPSTPPFSLAYLVAVRDIQYQLMAASTFSLWDLLVTFDQEVEYIWQMRHCMFKWFYFYFRYVLLAAQIFHLAVLPILSSGHLPDYMCTAWYRYSVSIGQLSLCMIEIILATRVFALFNRNRKVGVFLCGLILLQSGVAGSTVARCSAVEYIEACLLVRPPTGMANIMTITTMSVQSIIMGMFILKHFIGTRLGWGRTPLLSFLVRDATSNYVTMFVLCGITLMVCGIDDMQAIGTLYWSISLSSAIGCRLILNMERFARKNPLHEDILLTSNISM